MKTKFIDIYKRDIVRDGSGALLEWLERSDFFEAPASTRFHGSHKGGLVEHSLNVYNRFRCDNPETKAICALLHDVCKVDFYKVDYRNAKNDKGQWEKVPYYAVDEKFPFGHGEKSVFIINRFMALTDEEAMAINWHMGGFDDRVKGGSFALSGAFEKYPLALKLHIADMEATYFDERREV